MLFRSTGEDPIEISGHGSPYIMQRILKLLIKNGARQASPGEFTQRSFLNGKMDLSQAEAVADLIASSSNASHTIAMKQMRGGYSEEIEILRQQLLDFSSLIELELDFSEEDVEFADRSELTKLIDKIQSVVVNLLDSFDLGNAIKNGVPVVIAGSPNTGKSTLLNTLLKDDRAIVSNIPGTTRDTIEEEITIDGINFRFVDTAGIRETTDTIEAIGVKKSLEMINASAIVLYMFDVHELTARSLHQIVDEVRSNIKGMKAKLIWVGNKIDKENIDAIKHEYEEFRNVVFISARNKTNIDKLIKVLVQKAN